MPYIDVKEVKRRAEGRWDGIIRQMAPEIAPFLDKPGKHGKCPHHGGTDGFRVFRDVDMTGGGYCNSCGGFADGLKLLAWATQRTFKEVLNDVNEILGGASVSASSPRLAPISPRRDIAAEDASIRRNLRWVYQSSFPLDAQESEPARLYLKRRGFSILPQALRCHPGLFWKDADDSRLGPFPALIALVENGDDRGVTVHRTYLTPDGQKAPVSAPKKVMVRPSDVSLHGSYIRLFQPGKTLGVSEGIETAIAVTEATGIPCWPLISAQFMAGFVPPRNVERVVVFCDKNAPTPQHPEGHGQEAGKRLVTRLRALGRRALLAVPPSPIPPGEKDIDWCDEFVRKGRASFQSVLAP